MLRILVVDDNHDVANSMGMLLEQLGNEARCTYSGEEAIAALLAYSPDVVLLDIGMPHMSGWEVARRIRSMPEGEQIALIAVSGHSNKRDRQMSASAGFDCHLLKPIELDLLEQLLKSIELVKAHQALTF